MPISVLIAKSCFANDAAAFGVFVWGPGISGPLVPLVGWMIGLWGWRAAAVISGHHHFLRSDCRLPVSFTEIYLQEEAAISSFEAVNTQALPTARRLSNDPQFTLREAMRLKAFWFLSTAMALRHYGHRKACQFTFVILLVDRGWTRRRRRAACSGLGADRRAGALSAWAGWEICSTKGK